MSVAISVSLQREAAFVISFRLIQIRFTRQGLNNWEQSISKSQQVPVNQGASCCTSLDSERWLCEPQGIRILQRFSSELESKYDE